MAFECFAKSAEEFMRSDGAFMREFWNDFVWTTNCKENSFEFVFVNQGINSKICSKTFVKLEFDA